MALSIFDFIIKYRRGKDNPTNRLSYRPDYINSEDRVSNPLADLLRTYIEGVGGERKDYTRG